MSTQITEEKQGIDSFVIRIIGCLSMLWSILSDSGIEGIHNEAIADCARWFSFTLFAFLLAQGIKHSSNKKMYFRRLFVFTVLSEVCYDLFCFGTPWNTEKQSVMLTVFISFLIMLLCSIVKDRLNNLIVSFFAIVVLSIGGINLANLIHCEFGTYGILISMLFYTSLDLSYPKLYQITLMGLYSFLVTTDTVIVLVIGNMQYSVPIAIFAIFALLITWLYNDRRGPNSLALKIVYYSMYPFFLLAVYLTKIILKS